MAKALGIGGIFFKSADPAGLRLWYVRWLGFNLDETAGAALFSPQPLTEPSECNVSFILRSRRRRLKSSGASAGRLRLRRRE